MLYLRKIYTLLIFSLFYTSMALDKELPCPPGTIRDWCCKPGETTLELGCVFNKALKDPNIPLNVQIDIQNSAHSGSHSGSHSGNENQNTSPSNFSSTINWPQQQVQAFFSRSWQEMFLSKETLIMTVTLSFSTYCYLCYQLKKAVWLIRDKGAWCNWKAEVTFETFKNGEKKELAQELLESIQTRYLNSSNPTDHVGPLNSFLEDYRRELYIFRSYFFIATWIKRLHLTKIFPINNQDIELLKEKIERLCYIKAIFFEWTCEYKTKRCTTIKKEPLG